MSCTLKLFMSTFSHFLWPQLLSSWHKVRRERATTAPSASRHGRQQANTDCLLCAVDTSSASCASSAGWKLRARMLNVHRSAGLLYFNWKLNRPLFFPSQEAYPASHTWSLMMTCVCCLSLVQQESEAVRHRSAVRSEAESSGQLWAGKLKEVSDVFSALLPTHWICLTQRLIGSFNFSLLKLLWKS